MKITSLITLLFLFISKIYSQDSIYYMGQPINIIDSKHLKQGVWKLFDKDGLLVECNFVNDQIQGEIVISKNGNMLMKILNSNNEEQKFIVNYNSNTIQGKFIKQENTSAFVNDKGDEYDYSIRDWIYQHSSVKPLYYGGEDKLRTDIMDNINPEIKNTAKGAVVVQFEVDEDGFIQNCVLLKKSSQEINDEVLKAIQSLPRWQPSFSCGNFIKMRYTMPINFDS